MCTEYTYSSQNQGYSGGSSLRRVGKQMGIDPELLGRHPFPGPGLAIRILGDITAEKVRILQEVDAIQGGSWEVLADWLVPLWPRYGVVMAWFKEGRLRIMISG